MSNTIPKFVYNGTTVELEIPLATDDYWEIKTFADVLTSISGKKQTSFDRNEEHKKIDIQFSSETLMDDLHAMYLNWASEGRTIEFYPDKDDVTSYDVTIVEKTFKAVRQVTGTNVFKVSFTIRKDI